MTRHLTEDELVLHFYGERRSEEPPIDAHLQACDECRKAFAALRETMQLVDDATVPEPGPDFERAMWDRVRRALPAPGNVGRRTRWLSHLASFPAMATAAAAVLAVGLAGYATRSTWMPSPGTPERGAASASSTTSTADAARGRERVLLTALNDHFQQSELLLVELMNAPESGGDLEFERRTAGDLLDSGRLYQASARLTGNPRLAAMLDDLESALVEIARSPDRINPGDFHSLRARIDHDSLLFKVRAVSRQIQDRQRVLSTE